MFRVLVVAAVVALSSAFSLRPAFAALANSTAASRHSHKASTRLGRLGGKLSTIASCGGANDHAKNLVLSVTPDAPKAGETVTMTFDYDLDKEVTSGSSSIAINYNGIPFSPTVDDLCVDQAGGVAPDPCPLKVGHHHNLSESDFPSGISGKITTTIKWTDQDGEPILCVSWVVRA